VSFTFNATLPTATDRLRRGLGDAVAPGLRSNEEYAATLIRYPDEALSLAVMAEGLAVEYAQQPDSISDEGTTITWRDRVKTWLALAGSARALVASTVAVTTSTATSLDTTREGDDPTSQYAAPMWWPI